MLNNNKQIVCISPHYWEDFWFRKQHFMSRFHKKGYKIAYIDPSFSMVRKPNITEREYKTNSFLGTKIKEIENKFFVIKPPQYLPFWTKPFFSNLNQIYIFSQLSFVLKKLGFQNYILWLYRSEHIHCMKYLNYGKLIFDITDDLAAYVEEDKNKYQYIENCTKSLIKSSNLVLSTAPTLIEKYQILSSDIHLIPNGYDSKLFSNKITASFIPEINSLHSPIVGFVGTLFKYLDYDLIEYIVKRNPEKTFVFAGPCVDKVRERWGRIVKYRNVIWLGRKKKEEIPSIISKFDICINPFKIDNLSKSVSPLKVFEYLAMRKPVVSVDMESLRKEKVCKLIYFAKDYSDFNERIDFALKNTMPESEYKCMAEYSWEALFNKAFVLVDQKLWK